MRQRVGTTTAEPASTDGAMYFLRRPFSLGVWWLADLPQMSLHVIDRPGIQRRHASADQIGRCTGYSQLAIGIHDRDLTVMPEDHQVWCCLALPCRHHEQQTAL